MHITCLETQLMHKNAKQTQNNSKFKHDTHIVLCFLCKKIKEGAAYVVSHTEVTHSLSEPRAFLREAPVCKKLIPENLSKGCQFFYLNMLVPWNDTMPSFMTFRQVLNLQEFKKPSFSMLSVEPRRLDIWISFPFLAWDLVMRTSIPLLHPQPLLLHILDQLLELAHAN